MRTVLLTGGTGTLGQQIVENFSTRDGWTVRVMSRQAAPGIDRLLLEWAQADLVSSDGVDRALKGIDVIIHAASDPSRAEQTDVEGTQMLIKSAKKHGIKHFVYLSIVGCDKIPLPLYEHKVAAEKIVKDGGVPWTVVRITPFHSLINTMLAGAGQMVPVGMIPSQLKFQPVDEAEAADYVSRIATEEPAGYVQELGGPQVLTLGEVAAIWREKHPEARLFPIEFPSSYADAARMGVPESVWKIADGFRSGSSCCSGEHVKGKVSFEHWLKTQEKTKRPMARV